MKRVWIGGSIVWLCLAPGAVAQSVCVKCTAPDAAYSCSIEKAEKLAKLGAIADKAVDQVCARELARTGKHAKCTVRRDIDATACSGVARLISLDALLNAATAAAGKASAPPAKAAPAVPAPPAAQPSAKKDVPPAVMGASQPPSPDGAPRTIQEMTERGGGANAWGCITSFFTKC